MMTLSSACGLEGNFCDCEKPKVLGMLDLEHYIQCEEVVPDIPPQTVSYAVYAVSKPTIAFPATACKATLLGVTVESFFSEGEIQNPPPRPIIN